MKLHVCVSGYVESQMRHYPVRHVVKVTPIGFCRLIDCFRLLVILFYYYLLIFQI